MKRSLILLLSFLLIFSPVAGAEISDSPEEGHWVYDNFELLNEAGLLTGYPDGTFRGDENATRYEAVELTGRVFETLQERVNENEDVIEAKIGEDHLKSYLTEDEVKELIEDSLPEGRTGDEVYEALQELEAEYDEDLEDMDIRVTTLEEELEKVRTNNEELDEKLEEKDQQIEELSGNLRRTRIISYAGVVLGIGGIARSW